MSFATLVMGARAKGWPLTLLGYIPLQDPPVKGCTQSRKTEGLPSPHLADTGSLKLPHAPQGHGAVLPRGTGRRIPDQEMGSSVVLVRRGVASVWNTVRSSKDKELPALPSANARPQPSATTTKETHVPHPVSHGTAPTGWHRECYTERRAASGSGGRPWNSSLRVPRFKAPLPPLESLFQHSSRTPTPCTHQVKGSWRSEL